MQARKRSRVSLASSSSDESDDDEEVVATPRGRKSSRVMASEEEDELELSRSIVKKVGERSAEMKRRRLQKQNTFDAMRRKRGWSQVNN